MEKHQHGIAEHGQPGDQPDIERVESDGGDRQRQQVHPDKRVAVTTGEIEQGCQRDDVTQQLHQQLGFADTDRIAQAPPGHDIQQQHTPQSHTYRPGVQGDAQVMQ